MFDVANIGKKLQTSKKKKKKLRKCLELSAVYRRGGSFVTLFFQISPKKTATRFSRTVQRKQQSY